ncbi:phosphopantetheine-binding protein [Basilea psittacipulmonis]|uniref:Acyl carrier protein n=1 Tax=Basilea psittacipulmonis DSM 24701 TaxID=1072685 RepID=A0A077DEK2_9BURK|nr:phosphopantetheine-binding protein [Basilea psittacipulmonis]AIL33260.1 acyl carrier protein [Basilea psittacipulmonis DSM 24701]
MNSDLALSIKQLIIDTLSLEDMTPEDIDTDAPLFGDGLGLDSVDALELGLAIQKKYGITMDSESQNIKENFYSVATLANYIASQNKE